MRLAGSIRFAAVVALLLALLPSAAAQQPAADLLVVVEDGGRQLSVVDGARLQLLRRFTLSSPVVGPPRFTPGGLFAFVGSRDGALARYDLREGTVTAQARPGPAPRGFALSADGRWLLAADARPPTLTLYDGDLKLLRRYPAAALDGGSVSAPSAVLDTGARNSFVVSFDTLPQLWEISRDPAAAPIFDGLVHDYRMGEAIASPGYLGVRRAPLEEPARLLHVAPGGREVLALPAAGPVQVIHLDVRRRIAALPVDNRGDGMLVAAFSQQGRSLLALAARDGSAVSIVDSAGWRALQTVAAQGRSVFLGSHSRAPQLWLGSQADGAPGGTLTLIDRQTLAVTSVLALPGQPFSLGFSRDGSRALVGLAAGPDALLVFDTRTLALLQRLPALGPAAAYPAAPLQD
jgi:hypothetical protein